jgi:biopolymer transport protein ExbD
MAMQLNATGGGKYALRQNSTINVTPFVDVMLVLLIIFMVALPAPTTFIPLNLPPAKAPTSPVDPPTVINIQLDGLFIGERATSLAALPADLARDLKKPEPTLEQVYLRADRKVRYRRFMDVINALQAAGYFKVALVNEDL